MTCAISTSCGEVWMTNRNIVFAVEIQCCGEVVIFILYFRVSTSPMSFCQKRVNGLNIRFLEVDLQKLHPLPSTQLRGNRTERYSCPASSETAYPTGQDPVNHQDMHTKQKKPWGQHLAYTLFPVTKSKKSPVTSCTQNGPLPPKQVEEEPQYKDGQYFSSIGINIKICNISKIITLT